MTREFHLGNRKRLYERLKKNSVVVLFSGRLTRKTADEYYPFWADRNFVYLTGLKKEELVLVAEISDTDVKETLYLLPPDDHQERWTGARVKPWQVDEISGIANCKYVETLESDLHRLFLSGNYENLYLDFNRLTPDEPDSPAYILCKKAQAVYPFLTIKSITPDIRTLRLIKQPCEIEAMMKAEEITAAGIKAMMHASKPGMYEYQYKAVWDYTLGQYSPEGSGFPPIISAGKNNFCIHYYAYTGQAMDGDMVLNDVGAKWDEHITDVSRGWPCNGKFTERQKLLYACMYATSNHMFDIIRPGMPMKDVDGTIRRYNYERLKDAGVLDKWEDIGKYMWHGGAHHVGYDTHDDVQTPEIIQPGMVFCVDIGVYHEEWGIGFRLEDNCLVTEDGCVNLSTATPRSVEEIEDEMQKNYF